MMNRRREAVSDYDRVADRSANVVITSYSTSFGYATRLLPEQTRTHIRNIYALVRVADEIVDDPQMAQSDAERDRLLGTLESETNAALASGHSTNLVVHAFARTALSFGVDSSLTRPFFASMRADLTITDHDVHSFKQYVYGSAEVVGLMCLHVLVDGNATTVDELTDGARRLGAAFQKINFLRDLHQDHDVLGRSYFPGVDPCAFTDTDRDRILRDVDVDLTLADRAVRRLPRSGRIAVRAAHSLFGELAAALHQTPTAEILRHRIRLSRARKVWIVLRAIVSGGLR